MSFRVRTMSMQLGFKGKFPLQWPLGNPTLRSQRHWNVLCQCWTEEKCHLEVKICTLTCFYQYMLWFKFILGLMFFELVSILFAIVPDYGNEYVTKEKKLNQFENFSLKTKFQPQHVIFILPIVAWWQPVIKSLRGLTRVAVHSALIQWLRDGPSL